MFERLLGVPRYAFDQCTHHWRTHLAINCKIGPPQKLTPSEQVLLFFLHLRQYIVNMLAAFILGGITERTVHNSISKTLFFFYLLFSPLVTIGNLLTRLHEGFSYFNEAITFVTDESE